MKFNDTYIPHLAEMYFTPDYDWSIKKARALFNKPLFAQTMQSFLEPSIFSYDSFQMKDCIEGMKQLPSNCFHLGIADPPFGIDYHSDMSQYNRISENVQQGYIEISSQDYNLFTHAWISQLARILKYNGSAYIFSGFNHLQDILNALQKVNLTVINHLIYEYPFGVYCQKKYVTSHYHLLFVVKDPKNYYFNRVEFYKQDILRFNRNNKRGKGKNATALPLELIQLLLGFSSKPADLIIDPFLGSGITAVACKGEYRHFVGFEKNINMQQIIQDNLDSMPLGNLYLPYSDRIKTQFELSQINSEYKRAYDIYLKKEGMEMKKE